MRYKIEQVGMKDWRYIFTDGGVTITVSDMPFGQIKRLKEYVMALKSRIPEKVDGFEVAASVIDATPEVIAGALKIVCPEMAEKITAEWVENNIGPGTIMVLVEKFIEVNNLGWLADTAKTILTEFRETVLKAFGKIAMVNVVSS